MDFSPSYSAELTRSDETAMQETQTGAGPCGTAPFALPIAPELTFICGLDFSRPQINVVRFNGRQDACPTGYGIRYTRPRAAPTSAVAPRRESGKGWIIQGAQLPGR